MNLMIVPGMFVCSSFLISVCMFITANIPNTPMQHGYKTQHSTVTALHTLNNTVAKGFNQMAPPARTITVALDMSKAFDTINSILHTFLHPVLITFPHHMSIPSQSTTSNESCDRLNSNQPSQFFICSSVFQ